MTHRVGTSGFAYPKWKPSFYPPKLPAKQFLSYYAGHFRAVEANNTFYRLPAASLLEGWAAQVPADFRFALKAPQVITHFKRLKECGEPVAEFLEVAAALKERLGPLLFQLPPNFKKDVARLRDFLALLPAGTRAAVEFRHASWFDDETLDLLRSRKVALCIADETDELNVPVAATTDWGYLRLRRPEYDDAALAMWADRIRAQPWHESFTFFMHEDTGTGPRFAAKLLELLAAPAAKRPRSKAGS